ncbi:hypothetical protein ACIOHO_15635 [Streptomyces sp. NPDC087849]|uniref:hypothetical protein n=1 Tax=Streptomyces sp. NPDC087849 TaxID=3365808 RepID=UPI003827C2CF
MDRTHRAARLINMRKTPPLRTPRPARPPETVLADRAAIDAATDDPTIHASTARIRAALDDSQPTI